MASSTFENLPMEILHSICEYLESSFNTSLHALAQASSRCHYAADKVLHRTIKMTIHPHDRLGSDIKYCVDRLHRLSNLKQIRILTLESPLPKNRDSRDKSLSRTPKFFVSSSLHQGEDELSEYMEVCFERFIFKHNQPTASYEEDQLWRPIADLIQHLPSLSDLFYGCPGQFPPCMLEALHVYRPKCRLHLATFRIRSLNYPAVDAHEQALITSPCLHSIFLTQLWRGFMPESDWRDLDGKEDYNEEAIQHLVVGLAPNLKKIGIYRTTGGWTAETHDALELPRRPWSGGTSINSQTTPRASCLQHLGLVGVNGSIVTRIDIENWNNSVNLEHLQSLKLNSHMKADALSYITSNCSLRSLRALVLLTVPSGHVEPIAKDYYNLVDRFLQSLPPLQAIKIIGLTSHVLLQNLFLFHGAALRRLDLSSARGKRYKMGVSELRLLQRRCTSLVDLTLTVQRTQGDSREVAMYEAFGRLPKLQILTLRLNSMIYPKRPRRSYPGKGGPDDEFWRQRAKIGGRLNGEVRDIFINRALDETLARSIFFVIRNSKLMSSLPLQQLTLQPIGGENLASRAGIDMGLCDVLINLGRWWLLTPHLRDDCPDEVVVTELERPGKEPYEHWSALAWHVKPIYRRIWPEQQPGSDWRNDWHSFPLSQSRACQRKKGS